MSRVVKLILYTLKLSTTDAETAFKPYKNVRERRIHAAWLGSFGSETFISSSPAMNRLLNMHAKSPRAIQTEFGQEKCVLEETLMYADTASYS